MNNNSAIMTDASWRESTRVWNEWFKLVAGCPSPAGDAASWAVFRNNAEGWWEEIASRERETQHRTKEFGDWIRGRSDTERHEQARDVGTKELDARGVLIT